MPIIKIMLPISGYAGPYTLLGECIDGKSIARFVVDVKQGEGDDPEWVETPIPLPLKLSYELAEVVDNQVFKMGFHIVALDFTIH